MKSTLVVFLWLLVFGLIGYPSLLQAKAAGNTDKPNIIFIMADDLGYGDIGVYGQQKIKTPNIDNLAKEGMRFTQHYAGSTVCGPSRASLLTGLHSGHSPVRGNPKWTNSGKPVDLSNKNSTIAKLLKKQGYRTAAIGKWGLSEDTKNDHESMPLAQGFDYFFGLKTHNEAHHYYWHRLFENNQAFLLKNNDHLTNTGIYTHDLFTEKAIDFVNRQKSTQPFFLYLAYTIPHLALTVPEDSKKQYQSLGWPKRSMKQNGHYKNDAEGNTTYAGMVSRMDRDIGKLLAALKHQGVDENTLVIFTSDNGHEYDQDFFNSNGALRGKKRDLYEGGIRVPMIAKWPKVIKKNSESAHLSAFWDIMPTFCQISAAPNCPKTDGISLLPTLAGKANQQIQHDYLYWEFNEKQGPIQALRYKHWKLVKFKRKPAELYNLTTDIAETTNLASVEPAITKIMLAMLDSSRSEHPEFTLQKLNPYKKSKPATKRNKNN
jgi:arylsulfatase A-like enzyme